MLGPITWSYLSINLTFCSHSMQMHVSPFGSVDLPSFIYISSIFIHNFGVNYLDLFLSLIGFCSDFSVRCRSSNKDFKICCFTSFYKIKLTKLCAKGDGEELKGKKNGKDVSCDNFHQSDSQKYDHMISE